MSPQRLTHTHRRVCERGVRPGSVGVCARARACERMHAEKESRILTPVSQRGSSCCVCVCVCLCGRET